MFTFKNVLRIVNDHRLLIVLRKSTKCNSKVSVIKTLNTENKYLYGALVETQKQRRKTILKKKVSKKMCLSQSADFSADAIIDLNPVENVTKTLTARKTRVSKEIKNDSKNDQLHLAERTNNEQTILLGSVPKTIQAKNGPLNSSPELININPTNVKEELKENKKDLPKIKKSQSVNLSNLTEFPLENSEKDFDFSVDEIKRIPHDDPEVKSKFSDLPSVSKIINATMSESSLAALKRWRTKMIADLGEEGFQTHYKAQLSRGSEFHETIRKKMMGETVTGSTEAVKASMFSLQWVWPLLNSTVAVESHIAHPQLCYRGVLDCVAKFKETPVIIEWKLSDKPKPQIQDTYDAPVQLCAYVGAFNYDNNFKFQINHGLVVVAYSNGSPADAFFLAPKHCQAYWKIWLARLNKFNNIGHLHTEHEIPMTF